jgi:hypothetical protein
MNQRGGPDLRECGQGDRRAGKRLPHSEGGRRRREVDGRGPNTSGLAPRRVPEGSRGAGMYDARGAGLPDGRSPPERAQPLGPVERVAAPHARGAVHSQVLLRRAAEGRRWCGERWLAPGGEHPEPAGRPDGTGLRCRRAPASGGTGRQRGGQGEDVKEQFHSYEGSASGMAVATGPAKPGRCRSGSDVPARSSPGASVVRP